MNMTEYYPFAWVPVCFLTMVSLIAAAPTVYSQPGQVSGHAERVIIQPGGLVLDARIDTGAEHSSLNAKNIEKFTRDGGAWLRFSVLQDGYRSVAIERPIHRVARIRRHERQIQERDVVLLGICLGKVFKTVEVNLVDRTGFDYQMLIGRSFLSGDFLVDPGRSFLLEPRCATIPQ